MRRKSIWALYIFRGEELELEWWKLTKWTYYKTRQVATCIDTNFINIFTDKHVRIAFR